jgi:hypothetical protein
MDAQRDARRSHWPIEIEGDVGLVQGLGEALHRSLADRQRYYRVRLDGIGRCGEVLVAVTSASGRLPLLFDRRDLEPAYVASVVRYNVDRFAF